MKAHARPLAQRDLEALLAVTRHLAAPFDLGTLLAEVAAAACRVLRAERCSVWLLDAAAQELVLRVASDLPPVRVPLSHGLVGACARKREPVNVPDCYADPRFDRSIDLQSGFHTRCSLTLPLIDHRDALVGVVQVLNKSGGPFGDDDIALATALAAQCAVALSRVALTAEAFDAERLRQQLELARVVQTSALPRALPQVAGYDMHAVFRPADETGGDAYDLALLGPRLLVALADAAGHGIAPALAVTQLQAMLRTAFRLGSTLEAGFAHVNDQLAETLPDGHFITAFVGEIDPLSHRLRFISGGQSPILLYRAASGGFERFKATSFPMGAMPLPRPCTAVECTLEPGDVLVLLSDGIYEYENGLAQPFGRDRVEAVVRQHAGQGTAAIAAQVLAAVQAFAGGAPQEDDVTMVFVRRRADGDTAVT